MEPAERERTAHVFTPPKSNIARTWKDKGTSGTAGSNILCALAMLCVRSSYVLLAAAVLSAFQCADKSVLDVLLMDIAVLWTLHPCFFES